MYGYYACSKTCRPTDGCYDDDEVVMMIVGRLGVPGATISETTM